VLTRYFDDSAETPDEVIDRAYVTSDELTRYEGILETYLKDRTVNIGGSQLKTIETSRTSANVLTGEIQSCLEAEFPQPRADCRGVRGRWKEHLHPPLLPAPNDARCP